MPFSAVLNTACELQAPIVRIWAGDKPSRQVDAAGFSALVDAVRRCADSASVLGITIVFELHKNTFTDSIQPSARLLQAIDHPFVGLIVSPLPTLHGVQGSGVRELGKWIVGLRCFNWSATGERYLLRENDGPWRAWISSFNDFFLTQPLDRYAFLKYVKDDSVESYLSDVETLNGILGTMCTESSSSDSQKTGK
jgi:3-dehydroshikimate dehydratase